MITDRDRTLHEQGLYQADRLRALQVALRERAADARTAANAEGIDERFAASLRGKASGYYEAATLITMLIAGNSIGMRRDGTAWRKKQTFKERRAQRRNEGAVEEVADA
jgi:hypothetical protein